MKTCLVVAHRGDTQFAPENSIPAFENAISKGTDAIEFDVHLTRDDQIIVHHDYYLGRTENGSGFIGDYSLEELQSYDIGGWFSAKYVGVNMPTLEDVLDLGKGKVRFEIELRCPKLAFLEKVLESVSQFGLENDVEITTPHIPLLTHLKQTNEGVRKGVFFDLYPEWKKKRLGQQHIIEWMILLDAQVAHMPYSMLESEFVERMQNLKLYVHGSNIGNESEMKSAISKEIDQFSTDELELALKVRDTIMNGVT